MALMLLLFAEVYLEMLALPMQILDKKTPAFSEKYTIPFASGLIAGESLLGILVAWFAVQGVI